MSSKDFEKRQMMKWDDDTHVDIMISMMEVLISSPDDWQAIMNVMHQKGYPFTEAALRQHLFKLRRKRNANNESFAGLSAPRAGTALAATTGSRARGRAKGGAAARRGSSAGDSPARAGRGGRASQGGPKPSPLQLGNPVDDDNEDVAIKDHDQDDDDDDDEDVKRSAKKRGRPFGSAVTAAKAKGKAKGKGKATTSAAKGKKRAAAEMEREDTDSYSDGQGDGEGEGEDNDNDNVDDPADMNSQTSFLKIVYSPSLTTFIPSSFLDEVGPPEESDNDEVGPPEGEYEYDDDGVDWPGR
ncbi:hypothetical protein F4778DRAFT_788522 [Xylariomycetidae sp. FL2044]|nr:hypothetical protein F4778DRAFT_788522 [Xylariomycetidae sp. FL2044]